MGIDISTYRCRIGTFRPGPGIDVVLLKLCVNYTSGIKTIGAVAFIGLLLIMAGVEMNPGPVDTPSNTTDIEVILKTIGLEKYTNVFLDHEIGVNEVTDMTPEYFKMIGITAVGVMLRIKKACKQSIEEDKITRTYDKCSMGTQGTENHYRIIVLLSNCGTTTTRRLLCKHIEDSSPSGHQQVPWTLDNFLSHNQQYITLFPNGKPRHILDIHKRLMFPTDGQPTNIEEWDLLLLCNLLIDACAPSSTTKLDLKKLKKIRNKVCHAKNASMSDEKYDEYSYTIKVILDRFLVLINDHDLTDDVHKQIKDVKDGNLTRLESSIHALDEWLKSQKDISNQIELLQENNEAQYEDVKEIKKMLMKLMKHMNKNVPETKLVMVVKNCNSDQEECICRKLIELVNPTLQPLEDETKDAITLAMKEAMKKMLSEDIQLQTVKKECISFYLKCPSVERLLDLWTKCTKGELTQAFQPVEECVRRLKGFANIRLEVKLLEKEFIRCLNVIVTEIVQETGSTYVHATLVNKKDEHYDHSDNQGTSIELDIKPTSVRQWKRILQNVESGSFTDDLQNVAVAFKDCHGINDVLIDAHLVSEKIFQSSVVASKYRSRSEIEDIDKTPLPVKVKHGSGGKTVSQNTLYNQFGEDAQMKTKRIFNKQRNVRSQNTENENQLRSVKVDENLKQVEVKDRKQDHPNLEDTNKQPRPDKEMFERDETPKLNEVSNGNKYNRNKEENENQLRSVKVDENLKQVEVKDRKQDHPNLEDITKVHLEKKQHLDTMLEKLGLKKWYPSKINLQDITSIDIADKTKTVSMATLPWRFLKQLVMAKSTARDYSVYEYFYPDDNYSDDKESELELSPIDMFIAIFYCCDPMLKQFICHKLSMCRQAVPFMLDDPSIIQNVILSFWPLRPIVVEWKNSQQVYTESFILDQPTKIVSFVRFGRPSFSKSKLQNYMMSVNEHDTFYNKDSPLGETDRLLCHGYIEASWYLPGGCQDMYDEFIMFLNVRGDLSKHFNQAQREFITISSAVVVIAIEFQTLINNTQSLIKFLNIGSNHILIISHTINDKVIDSNVTEIANAYHSQTGDKLTIVYTHKKEKQRNVTELEMVIRRKLKKKLKFAKPIQFDNLLKPSSDSCIKTDEDGDEFKAGKQFAETLFSKMKQNGTQEQWKATITPLQYKYFVELSEQKKKLQRTFNKFEDAEEIKNKIKLIKECQSNTISDPVRYFIQVIITQISKRNTILYFIEWLKIFIDDISRDLLPTLRKTYYSEWQILNDMKRNEQPERDIQLQMQKVHSADKLIANASFGVEHLFREVGQIFELATSLHCAKCPSSLPSVQEMSKSVAILLSYGYPFELLDGDASNMPTDWVKAVLTAFQTIIGNKKFLTMSVLGVKSSGKSTLLNTMFGLKFAVSAGRCTRGVNIQMVQVIKSRDIPFDYIMVIDSEGLRAPEINEQKKDRDNELATFVIGLSDFTLLNIKGENTSEINDVLEITIHAFLRLKAANRKLNLRKKCIFVHQNVPAVKSKDKMKYCILKLVERLDSMTKEAAESENLENITTFNQIIEFDGSKHVWYIPDLWQGDPPMAAINKDYSATIEGLRSSIIHMAISETKKSYKCLPDIITHADELWKGILSEDFVFSFKNSLEINAYLQMESKFKDIAWELECFVRSGIQSEIKSRLNNCSTDIEVDRQAAKLYSTLKLNTYNAAENSKKEMELFFEQSVYVEIVINWKANRMNSLKELTDSLANSLRKEIDHLSNVRKVQILTSLTLEKHIECLNSESIKLAKTLKGNNLSQKEMDDSFEKIWQKFCSSVKVETESEIKSTRQMFIDTLLDVILTTDRKLVMSEIKNFNQLEINLELGKLDGSFKIMGITDDYILTTKNFFKKVVGKMMKTTKDYLDLTERHTNRLFHDTDVTVERFKSKEGELKQPEVKEILFSIRKWLKQNDKNKEDLGFTVNLSFKIRLYVFISCHVSGIFDTHNVQYIEKHGLKAKMKRYRAQIRTIFDECLKNRKAEATASTLL